MVKQVNKWTSQGYLHCMTNDKKISFLGCSHILIPEDTIEIEKKNIAILLFSEDVLKIEKGWCA